LNANSLVPHDFPGQFAEEVVMPDEELREVE
jgi:hypothetical protein